MTDTDFANVDIITFKIGLLPDWERKYIGLIYLINGETKRSHRSKRLINPINIFLYIVSSKSISDILVSYHIAEINFLLQFRWFLFSFFSNTAILFCCRHNKFMSLNSNLKYNQKGNYSNKNNLRYIECGLKNII